MTTRRRLVVGGTLLLAVGVVTAVVTVRFRDGARSDATVSSADVPLRPLRLLDTRGAGTFDGLQEDDAVLTPGHEVRIAVASRLGPVVDSSIVALDVAVVDPDRDGTARVFACGDDGDDDAVIEFGAGRSTATQVVTPVGSDGAVCAVADGEADLVVDFAANLPSDSYVERSASLLSAVDDDALVTASVDADEPIEIPIAAEDVIDDDVAALRARITTATPGELKLYPCDGPQPEVATFQGAGGEVRTSDVIVPFAAPPSGTGRLCVQADRASDVAVELDGYFRTGTFVTAGAPQRLLDTNADGTTLDGEFAADGLRPAQSTLRLPVAGRGAVPLDATSAVLRLRTSGSTEPVMVAAHAPGQGTPDIGDVYSSEGAGTAATSVIVPIGHDGTVCLYNSAPAHLVADVIGWFSAPSGESAAAIPTPTPPAPDLAAVTTSPGDPGIDSAAGTGPSATPAAEETGADDATRCPAQSVFPHWRMVAMYGTQRSAKLGVLGEQDPEAAVARLLSIMEPWAIDDRPLLGAFELITVLATAAPGDDGLYNLPASEEFVQQYLDAARRHGVHLILDLQTGRSDFLTEAKRYESFLREPDVGLALDPEWRTDAPDRPRGGFVGHVDADEVNAVALWLSEIVREEQLPDKLLVVHQFQDQMIRNRERLVEPPGITLTIHMDGLGTREQKLDTYSYVRTEPPWNNGLKLFYDEDVDIFRADEVLDGAFEPIPDLITYQ